MNRRRSEHGQQRSAQSRQAKRLAGTPTRCCCAQRARPTSRRRSARSSGSTTAAPAYLLESVEGGERLGRYSFLGVGPRRLLHVRDGRARHPDATRRGRSLRAGPAHGRVDATDPLLALRSFVARRRVVPLEGMPRFTGGAVGALAYDAVSAFEPTVPMPESDPVGVPLAAFIETDLVLVFDHLTHTLSAIASLHTEAPNFEARYAIAERAIFEVLERTRPPSATELAAASRNGYARRRWTAAGIRSAAVTSHGGSSQTSLRSRGVHRRAVAKNAIAAGEAIQVVLARRQSIELPRGAGRRAAAGIELYRASAASTRARTSSTSGCPTSRSSARARSCCCRSRATGSRRTRSPARDRAAPRRPRTRSCPSSCSATPRSAPST